MKVVALLWLATANGAVLPDAALAQQTLRWLDKVVIAHNLCPFAAASRMATKAVVCGEVGDPAMTVLQEEVKLLRAVELDARATTLLILPAYHDFATMMEFRDEAEDALAKADGDHDTADNRPIQLLAFHPDAAFEDQLDPADFSLRSPHPMIHLLRDSDVEGAEASWALRHHPEEPPSIQERNAAYLRGLGVDAVSKALREALEEQ